MTTSNCCSKPCNTPFCPYCGNATNAGTLDSLRQYLRGHKTSAENALENLKNRIRDEKEGSRSDRLKKHLRRKAGTLRKWTGWLEIVEKLSEVFDEARPAAKP